MPAFSAFPPQLKRRRGAISASSSATVLVRPLSDLRALKVIVAFFNTVQDKTKLIELNIIHSDGSLQDQMTKLGVSPSLSIDSVIDGTDLKINVTNNEAYEVKFNLSFVDYRANF